MWPEYLHPGSLIVGIDIDSKFVKSRIQEASTYGHYQVATSLRKFRVDHLVVVRRATLWREASTGPE
jgi:hypothetical protein